ncbi:ornithine-acyl-ACP acyltransferase [Paracoccus jeotgali]|uniref:L-ornithine N(alpha)-acyltransferase n=1 Tax=Paracoccus jeotgali TaxID=2065379 RepID=A0A2K9MIH7_9RHOB|nr:ornithine-acyl-ACP acyltransferase [Paracoccus jeotgali]
MLSKGRYIVREAADAQDLLAAQRLRWLGFVGQRQGVRDLDAGPAGVDADDHDAACRHVLILDRASAQPVATFRFLHLDSATEIERSYSARFYDLARLHDFAGPVVEMGRFCVHPGHSHPDILRMAWGWMTRHVDAHGVRLLFGCSSFAGTGTQDHADSFALLRARHLAPRRWLPRVKAPQVFRFGRAGREDPADPRRAMAGLPPLLRSYLAMGGWVSDHAVVDRSLDTLHVFTGLEIAAIPPARQRLLRAVSGQV